MNKTGEALLEHEKQISGGTGYSDVEFGFSATPQFHFLAIEPFLHVTCGEDGNVAKRQSF